MRSRISVAETAVPNIRMPSVHSAPGNDLVGVPSGSRVVVAGFMDARAAEATHPGLRVLGGFPSDPSGGDRARPPADGPEVVGWLEASRRQGAEYLVVPREYFPWIDGSPALRRHLDATASLVQWDTAVRVHALERFRWGVPGRSARVVALACVRNEARFIGNLLRHMHDQGVGVYLLDNGSTDGTRDIAEGFRGRGLVGMEDLPFDGAFNLPAILRRKEALQRTLEADWFLHLDADEVRLAPEPGWTLAQAFAAVEDAGYNAVNFLEYTFVPTAESPEHDHPDYLSTMRWYYPFAPRLPHRVNAWRKGREPVDLTSRFGHRATFPGLRLCPAFFPMRHYQFLGIEHVRRKYGERRHDPDALSRGGHGGFLGWRHNFRRDRVRFPSQVTLREYLGDHRLDASHPRAIHAIAEMMSREVG